jgi:hypothetical protein
VAAPFRDKIAPEEPYVDAKFAQNRKSFVSDRFKQIPIAGAKHDYRGYNK